MVYVRVQTFDNTVVMQIMMHITFLFFTVAESVYHHMGPMPDHYIKNKEGRQKAKMGKVNALKILSLFQNARAFLFTHG